MWALRVILCVVVCAWVCEGRLVSLPDFWYLETSNNSPEQAGPVPRTAVGAGGAGAGGAVWAVHLHGPEQSLTLRPCNRRETDYYRQNIQPVIDRFEESGGKKERKEAREEEGEGDDVTGAGEGEEAARDEVWRNVNKWIVSTTMENHPKITVFVSGDGVHGALSVSCGSRVWDWVLRPPSPLPAWLHQHAKRGGIPLPAALPSRVQARLYSTLRRLTSGFLRQDLRL